MRLLCLCLLGCPAVFDPGYEAVRDLDGDGSIGERFGGPDCRDDDPSVLDCDVDGDGVRSTAAGGTDCDDLDPDVFPGAPEACNERDDDCDGLVDNQDPDVQGPVAFWADADGDGSGDAEKGYVCQEFLVPGDPSTAVHAEQAGDCDDRDFTIGPHADEVCDGRDNDCDGTTDDVGTWLRDDDGDGFGVDGSQATGPCELQPDDGVASVGGDCDDTDAAIAPGAPENPYDGIDQACNGGRDDWDADYDGYVPDVHWAAAQAANDALPPDERWHLLQGDCDDTDPRVNAGAAEVCDGVDNDCDGTVDTDDLLAAGPTDELALRAQLGTWYLDADGDGGFGTPVLLCPEQVTSHHSPTGDDCFDGGIAPAGFEGADPAQVAVGLPESCDGFDNDCDGRVDFALTSFPGSQPLWLDNDADGFGSAARFGCAPDPANALVDQPDDCNDGAANVFPGAPEICGDAIRQDCSTADIFDCDGDGVQGTYVGGGDGADCEDTDPTVNPMATVELCDGLDNDCDGLVDSADTDDLDAGSEPLWFPDVDGDGYGFDDGSGVQQCDQPAGRAPNALDCDDTDATRSPETRWYADVDGDGFGSPASVFTSCDPPGTPATVQVAGDCDDTDPLHRPGATWSYDADGDGFGATGSQATFCRPPAGQPWVAGPGTDCDDTDASRNPGAVDLPDGIDNDCDGVVDGVSGTPWYVDADGDGYGESGSPALAWAPGHAPNADDCDDTRASVNPGAQIELCNGRDDNCDGFSVDGSPDVSNPWSEVVLAGDVGLPYVGSYPQGPSLDLLVVTCSTTPATGPLQTPDGPQTLIPLQDVGLPLATGARTCADGSAGIPVYRDRDGDGTGGVTVWTDIALACPTIPPGFEPAGAYLDCAPDDPERWETLTAGDFGDRDGDGVPGAWSVPGACIYGDSSVVFGTDCDDDDRTVDGADAQGNRVEVDATNLLSALNVCDHAELAIQGDATANLDAFTGRPGLDLTVTGTGTLTVELVASSHLEGRLVFRDLILAAGPSWPVAGELVLERVEGTGLSLQVNGGTVQVVDSELIGGSDPHVDLASGEVHVQGSVLSGGVLGDVSGGRLQIDDTTLASMTGLSVTGGAFGADGLHLEQVTSPLTVTGGGVELVGLTANPPSAGSVFEVLAGSLVCQHCTIEAPGTAGPLFLASGGTTRLDDTVLEVNAGPAVRAQLGGTLVAHGLTASATDTVIENDAVLELHDTTVSTDHTDPVLLVGSGTRTVLDGFVAEALVQGSQGMSFAGGSLEARHVRLVDYAIGLDLQGPGPFDLDDLFLTTDGGPTAVGIRAGSGAALTLSRPQIQGSGTALATSGNARVVLTEGDLIMHGTSGIGLRHLESGRLTVSDTTITAGSVGILVDADGGITPSLDLRRSRVFTLAAGSALDITDGSAFVQQSLLHGAGSLALVHLDGSPASFDRVTLRGHEGNALVASGGSDPLVLRNVLITVPEGPTNPVATCNTSSVQLEDTLIDGLPGCLPLIGLYTAGSQELDPSLDPTTYLPVDPAVLPWFGEAALGLPYPGGF